MKNVFCVAFLFILMCSGIAQAAWEDDFVEDYDEFGMDVAVENALNDDVTPKELLTFIISNSDDFERKRGLKALYCAGADREIVREAANKLGITVDELSVSLEESIAECGDKITLSDRDIIDKQGRRLGQGERDTVPLPDHVELPDHVDPPTRPRPASPSTP